MKCVLTAGVSSSANPKSSSTICSRSRPGPVVGPCSHHACEGFLPDTLKMVACPDGIVQKITPTTQSQQAGARTLFSVKGSNADGSHPRPSQQERQGFDIQPCSPEKPQQGLLQGTQLHRQAASLSSHLAAGDRVGGRSTDKDVARVQVSVHKVVAQQHLQVGIHPKRHHLHARSAKPPVSHSTSQSEPAATCAGCQGYS